ncbi:pyridoxal-dependent decarboxylase, exosortase A system-associated [Vibrio lentus]|uniref:pyridoxal-dependent decarboxylase, exosortase A system-associated n=1 Tax=Vibrio lentus TaxID=136468 RepID=UPI000C82BDF5|nr:pyridoxal-dependent decarboxylase, exosortase A system-associated [Vibrio lentus]PMG78014.1 pyridoxal-dependent decarboxylase, exosortase A system-associated [Vibrio lentus]
MINNLTLKQCEKSGQILIGGKEIKHHVERLGKTPCYLYDRQCIENRVSHLKSVLGNEIDVYYAIKANPIQSILDWLVGKVDGFDISSSGELNKALDAGMPGEKVHFSGPGKQKEELYRSLIAGALINIESEREVEILSEISDEIGTTARVSFRVNPKFETRFSGMVMGGKASQFGIDEEEVPKLIVKAKKKGLNVIGLHYFMGSQVLNSETIINTQKACYESALNIQRETGCSFSIINLGGGFGIPYFKNEVDIDIESVAENLRHISTKAKKDFSSETRIKVELGRYIVGPAGVYVTKVTDKKVSRGSTFVVVDGGMHHHLAATGNLGQFLRKNYPISVDGKIHLSETVNIVGPLCTPLDILATQIETANIEPGDLIAVFASGAYGKSASPADFLSHPSVAEALI